MSSSRKIRGKWSMKHFEESAVENEDLETFFRVPIPPPVSTSSPISSEGYETLQREKWRSNGKENCSISSSSSVLDDESESNDGKNFFGVMHSPSFYAARTYHSSFDTSFDRRMSNLGCNATPKPLVNQRSRYSSSSSSYSREMKDAARSTPITGSRYSPYARKGSVRSGSPERHSNKWVSPLQQSPKRYAKHQYLPRYDHQEIKNSFPGIGFIDTHCHLDFLFSRMPHTGTFEEFRKMQKDSFPISYEGCVTVFCKPFSFAQEYLWKPILEEDGIWAAFGCHPHHAYDYNDDIHSALIKALDHHKVRALGEIGLDYSVRNKCPKAIQHHVFKRQLKLAGEKSLPLVIHNRDAFDDCLEIMKKFLSPDHKIHMHCCMDSWETVKAWLDAFPNLFIGLTNVVTFPTAIKVHEVARNIPLDRLLLETDAPYFVPRTVPKRMKWSHPGMAIHVAAQISALRNIKLEEMLKAVRQNTTTMYGI